MCFLSHSHIVLFTAGRDESSIPYLPNLFAPPLLNRKWYPPDHRRLRGHNRARALLILTTLICLREVVLTQGPCLQDRSNIAIVQFGGVVGRPLTGDELAGKLKAGSHIPLDHPIVVGPCVEGVDTAFRRPRLQAGVEAEVQAGVWMTGPNLSTVYQLQLLSTIYRCLYHRLPFNNHVVVLPPPQGTLNYGPMGRQERMESRAM